MRWIPTQGPNVPKISLMDWLGGAFSIPDQVTDDIHFDQLAINWGDIRSGEEWVPHGRSALREVKRMASVCANLIGVRNAVVALPLGESRNIRTWKRRYWRTAGMRTEPPSLIVTKASFDERYDEEYHRRLDVFDGADGDLTAVFRSQRRLQLMEEGGAFDNVIFLIATIS
jgi:hypothetical protein